MIHWSHVCGPIVLIENNISISIECENGINFSQFLAREMVAVVARREKQVLEKARLILDGLCWNREAKLKREGEIGSS